MLTGAFFYDTSYLMKKILLHGLSIFLGFTLISFSEKVNNISGIDRWWPVLLGSGIVIASLTVMLARSDAKKYIQGLHWRRVLYRSAFLVGWSWVILQYSGYPLSYQHWFIPSGIFASFTLFNACVFGIIFDPITALERGKAWDYVGNEAWYDRLQRHVNVNLIFAEIAGLIGSVYWFTVSV